ncbi:hypothetical protein GE061_003998 [Apolygus lucorum]|uniref:Uncharacterized protein n=1 Tax=Apolygus lucorum TaxID=248454 RepID=A0A8S9X0M4_APOLU|nr:hypothetical protein GE061_003998 [Apolygus lucorum]
MSIYNHFSYWSEFTAPSPLLPIEIWKGPRPTTVKTTYRKTKGPLRDVSSSSDIIRLLAVFHLRGTRVSDMRRSTEDQYKAEFAQLKNGISDDIVTNKQAVTLSRISICLPSLSHAVAESSGVSELLKELFQTDADPILGINAIPCLLAYESDALSFAVRNQIWRMNTAANVYIAMHAVKKGGRAPTNTEALVNAKRYMKLAFNNTKDSQAAAEVVLQKMKRLNTESVEVIVRRDWSG